MTDHDKLDAVITSLIDTLHTGMEKSEGDIPPNILTALSSSIDNLTAARTRLPPSRAKGPVTLEAYADSPPLLPPDRR